MAKIMVKIVGKLDKVTFERKLENRRKRKRKKGDR